MEAWRFTDLRGFDPDSFSHDSVPGTETGPKESMVDVDAAGLAYAGEAGIEIESAPEFDESRYRDDPAYRAEIASYYAAREPVGTTHTGEMR